MVRSATCSLSHWIGPSLELLNGPDRTICAWIYHLLLISDGLCSSVFAQTHHVFLASLIDGQIPERTKHAP